MPSPLYIAVDLGAGSGRVFLAGVDPGELLLEEIHRFRYPPRQVDGNLRWDFGLIFEELKFGLRAAGERARELLRPIRSIGVDSWGVDLGLLDAEGRLIADPACYRDMRTAAAIKPVFDRVSRKEIFDRTGIQFLPFNSLFQLFAGIDEVSKATSLLLIPDLINYYLTGQAVAEYTNATTTQLVSARTGDWDRELMERVGLPVEVLPRIVPAGTELGPLKPDLANELGLEGVRVIAPATHDTGSAVAGAPLLDDTAYISSGTWSLIGVELNAPLINDDAARLNFTNEGGAFGTFRFLKNVMGLWIFESCRNEWAAAGLNVEYEELLEGMGAISEAGPLIFPDDERFLNPPSMLDAIAQQLSETGQTPTDDPKQLCKTIFDSLAFRYASVLRSICSLTGTAIAGILILGGGGKNAYLNQVTANVSGLTVKSGLTEATVLGNVLVQAIATGRFSAFADARRHVAENVQLTEYRPEPSDDIAEARERYDRIEARFLR